jgi:hypothetical protein
MTSVTGFILNSASASNNRFDSSAEHLDDLRGSTTKVPQPGLVRFIQLLDGSLNLRSHRAYTDGSSLLQPRRFRLARVSAIPLCLRERW